MCVVARSLASLRVYLRGCVVWWCRMCVYRLVVWLFVGLVDCACDRLFACLFVFVKLVFVWCVLGGWSVVCLNARLVK